MSTPVTYVGSSYNVPAYQDTGYAQGTGNLSSYLIALATGSLTLSGGSFPLTADVDFGANFGLKSIYYQSRATFIPTVGIVRMGTGELVAWRNFGNTGNITLGPNASDQMVLTGADLLYGAGKGMVCTTPDGLHTYRIAIDNDGTVTTEMLS